MTRGLSIEGYKRPERIGGFGNPPTLKWIALADLVVDDSYQREIRGAGRRNVERIAAEFRWAMFAPVIVSAIPGEKFAIVDGQHRTTAAALIGIEKVPCMIIVASRAEQAASFHAINGAVTKITRQQLHAAAVAARDGAALEIEDVCSRAAVTILRYPLAAKQQRPGMTMAVGCIADCLQVYGRDTLVTALQCITETANKDNVGLLVGQIIRGLCEVLGADARLRDSGSRLLDIFDDIDIDQEFEAALMMPKPKGRTVSNNFAIRIRERLKAVIMVGA